MSHKLLFVVPPCFPVLDDLQSVHKRIPCNEIGENVCHPEGIPGVTSGGAPESEYQRPIS